MVTTNVIACGQTIMEYVGEVKEFDPASHYTVRFNLPSTITKKLLVVDGEKKGNLSRFAATSHTPNMFVRQVTDPKHGYRLVFTALREINIGEPLEWDYKWPEDFIVNGMKQM